jgi:hypothetical protein
MQVAYTDPQGPCAPVRYRPPATRDLVATHLELVGARHGSQPPSMLYGLSSTASMRYEWGRVVMQC